MNDLLNNRSIDLNNSKYYIFHKLIKIIFGYIIPILLIVVFLIRTHLHNLSGIDIRDLTIVESASIIRNDVYYLDLPKARVVFAAIGIWLEYLAIISIVINKKYQIKTIKIINILFNLPISILNLVFFKTIYVLFLNDKTSLLFTIFYITEIVLNIILTIHLIVEYIISQKKLKYQELLIALGIFLLMLIPTMPTFIPQLFIGNIKITFLFKELSFAHRILLYLGIIIPFVIYLCLRNKDSKVIEFSLTFISLGVLVGFMLNYNYLSFTEPWAMPFHLCNTALYIIPLCLIFKLKRLFYFTYFINVIGALLAMAMPNYKDTASVISPEMIRFWYNHWAAFFMPILIVALKVFSRPKLKEFSYSMIAFLVYFVFVLILNVYFTSLGHSVDYFFINSDFIPDKFGKFGEKIFEVKSTFYLNDKELVIRPLYQTIFFLVYVALGFGELFIYNELYKISDNNERVRLKLKLRKENKLHFESLLTDEDRRRIKEDNMETELVLNQVSKKYGNNKHYSVHDVSLKVAAGEIFGFLGPNGAGKSTIIKSIVGIQPLTAGSITICGYDILNQPVLAKYNIGYVPDHYALYEKLTGREYINYIADIFEVSLDDRNARLEKYIKIFELEHAIDNKIATYSHGMKQKITIMAALVHNPKVWILDEPLTGLDPNSIYQVKQCMKLHASEGNIVFFSSHLIDIVEKLCQRIAIIKNGELQVVESVQEIEKIMPLEEYYMHIIGNDTPLKEE